MHMAMAAIPDFLWFSIEGSIRGRWGVCQWSLWGNRRRAPARGQCQRFPAVTPRRLYDNIVICHNSTMSASRKRASRVFTISFPADLADQVTAVAEEESRNISELFREAFRSYRRDRIHRKLAAARADAATRGAVRYTENDVEAIVDEIRAEQSARRKRTA